MCLRNKRSSSTSSLIRLSARKSKVASLWLGSDNGKEAVAECTLFLKSSATNSLSRSKIDVRSRCV